MKDRISSLCVEVLQGDMTSAAVLLDLLTELNDYRMNQFAAMLGSLISSSELVEQRLQEMRTGRRMRSPEEIAYRRDQDSRQIWISFATLFQDIFRCEVVGKPSVEDLRKLESILETKKQAERLNQVGNSDGESDLNDIESKSLTNLSYKPVRNQQG